MIDQIPPVQEMIQVPSQHGPSLEWIIAKTALYPELYWLAEGEISYTQEGSPSAAGSWSEILFGERWIEFDRSATCLLCLHWIVEGSEEAYQAMTASQETAERLSRESFLALHQEANALLHGHPKLSPAEVFHVMEAGIILGDIGKSALVRERFAARGGPLPADHDDFLEEAFHRLQQCPELSPTFLSLNQAERDLLTQGSHLIHYGHVSHMEGGRNMFAKLKASEMARKNPYLLHLDQFLHRCDVAGAAGHIDCRSSKAYTERTHRILECTFAACNHLTDAGSSESSAMQRLLEERGRWLGIDPADPERIVCIRAGAMLRLITGEEGRWLESGWKDVPHKESIIQFLGPQGLESQYPTPTYMPAVLLNMMNHQQLGTSREERIGKALSLALPFFAEVLQEFDARCAMGLLPPSLRLNFNDAAGVAKRDPGAFRKPLFRIEHDGTVLMQAVAQKSSTGSH